MKTLCNSLTVAVVLVGLVPNSYAGLIILGNLPPVNDGSFVSIDAGTDSAGSPFTSIHSALSFTMPARSYPLSHVALRLGQYNTVAGDVAEIGIYGDDGNDRPGALISLLSNPPSGSDDIAQFNFEPQPSLTLSASTKYWLVVDASEGEYAWRRSGPIVMPTSEVGATFGKELLFIQEVPRDDSPNISNFEIVTLIPEPSTAGLVWVILGGLFSQRRLLSHS